MLRFILLAVPLVVLWMAVFSVTVDVAGLLPSARDVDFGFGRGQMAPVQLLAVWLLESVGLTAFFLLVHGRFFSRWLDGLATAWLAWTFRGPLLVLTVAGATRLPREPWWTAALSWWVLYTVAGLLLAALAGRLLPRADPAPAAKAAVAGAPDPVIEPPGGDAPAAPASSVPASTEPSDPGSVPSEPIVPEPEAETPSPAGGAPPMDEDR